MQCPHCQIAIHGNPYTIVVGKDINGAWGLVREMCPSCGRIILILVCAEGFRGTGEGNLSFNPGKQFLVYPQNSVRPPPPKAVPKEFSEDYVEAALVLPDSPKASAALSRRCLQHVLREKAGIKKADLAKEIDQVISMKLLPSHLAEAVDAVRNIGNFAAHPIKSASTGEVVPVEAGEAEWNLDVLDGLFDFFFVQPEVLKKRREALNAKLAEAGKPAVK